MPHSYCKDLFHVVFSTKDRMRYIDAAIRNDLHAYLGGILREIGGTALTIGGIEDHVHFLMSLPPEVAVSDCLRVVKTNSSKWVHERWPDREKFAWQSGFASFSVSASNEQAVRDYIATQEQHHRKVSFQDEFIALLRKHGVPFDERYLWN